MSAITGLDYIIINGVSSDTVGLYIDTPPMPPMQAQNFQTVSIPNRPEELTLRQITRQDIQVNITAYLFRDDDSSNPADIYAYLDGAKTLQTSKNEDFEYRVTRFLGVTPSYQGHGKQLLTLSFMCAPYRYAVENDVIEISGQSTIITVGGSVFCQPVYKLYGSGNLELTVNEDTANKLTIADTDGYVIADGEKLICYKDGTFIRFGGKIPFLGVGDNLIETNATKIEIVKNERWL